MPPSDMPILAVTMVPYGLQGRTCDEARGRTISMGAENGHRLFVMDYLQRFWRWFIFTAAAVILLAVGVLIFETLPPRTVVMATGAEGGANYELGIRYREILEKAGVRLELRTTTGSME